MISRAVGLERWAGLRVGVAFLGGVVGAFWMAGNAGVLAVVILAAALFHTRRAGRAAVLRAAESSAWGVACGRMAVALGAGADLAGALESSAGHRRAEIPCRRRGIPKLPVLGRAAAAIRLGGDPAEFLDGSSGPIGPRLAGALVVARKLGISPRSVVLSLVDAQTHRQQAEREVRVALASARATARLLAALPAGGLALITVIGGRASRFLFAGSLGRGCLVLAAILEAGGLVWMQRISDRAAR